jgi:hypothetical protein
MTEIPMDPARKAKWFQLLQDSRKLLEDALAKHRHQDVSLACTKLRWIWEEMATEASAGSSLRILLSDVALSCRRPDEILQGILAQEQSPETWKVVLDARDAIISFANQLAGTSERPHP